MSVNRASPSPRRGYCPYCGDPYTPTDLNCAGCGARLPGASAPQQAPPAGHGSLQAAPPPDAAPPQDRLVNTARNLKTFQVVMGAVGLVKMLPFLLLFEGILIGAAAFGGMPWVYPLCGAAIAILLVAVDVIAIRRMAAVPLDPSLRPAAASGVPLALAPGETLRLRVAPILWSGVRITTLGAGTVKNPHNALLVTDRSLLFVVVPLPGVGQLVGGTDYSLWHLLREKEALRQKLDAMLARFSLEAIARSDAANLVLPLAEMKTIVFPKRLLGLVRTGTFTFVMRSGQKYRYTVWDKDDLARLMQALTANPHGTQPPPAA